jgi:hypothetical protein
MPKKGGKAKKAGGGGGGGGGGRKGTMEVDPAEVPPRQHRTITIAARGWCIAWC